MAKLSIAAALVAAIAIVAPTTTLAFAPPSSLLVGSKASSFAAVQHDVSRNMITELVTSDIIPSTLASASATISSSIPTLADSLAASSSSLLSFTDQGNNLAGIFFQASLLPYLAFLYFLSFRGNRTPNLGNFGFQYLLLFVLGTIPSGIITKSVYGETLANVDWLHGGAEALLTITNVLLVLGFRDAMTSPDYTTTGSKYGVTPKIIGGVAVLIFAAACFNGANLGFEAHSQFLFGAGNLPSETVLSLPFVQHSEPVNALSIPTWAIHFSSVFEYLFAMDTIWRFAETTDNPKWKGLTWGMLPLHASGIAACTYHFFYNPSSLQFVVELQAFFTLLGNLTCAIAAYRIAVSNGWALRELNPFPKSEVSPEGIAIDEAAALPYNVVAAKENDLQLAAKLMALTVGSSYVLKYGELALDLPLTENGAAAGAIIFGIPAITAYLYYNRGKEEGGEGFSLPSFGSGEDGEGLSMADVKKFGVSGTVAYILTELAFWAVAFPVASNALYQTTGHWPDVFNDTSDRAAVLAFIFGAANIARLLVPLRLGAALALAPWVDKNIINRDGASDEQP
eukprot:CAMPEP_0172311554 /NCGR_PEP_ID=MMETSP1058-20130122/15112_1 /TAXON_ID=83371 /ORGANISM="Detonula confervacea, Strain CCMP 353" /LENGTH=567 /DNA_ID=CAMNT_0013024777 /DNA_START=35 /DNA_END=1738 /DNA_ORIENTATION=+